MKKRFLLAAALAVTTPLALSLPAGAERPDDRAPGGRPFHTRLSGEAEVPGPGDPDGKGTAKITVDVESGQVCYSIKVKDIDAATMAHLHEAPAGASGPVRQGLAAPADGTSRGCVVNPGLAQEIADAPADYYVNVHNPAFPAGALRGQLG